jgi:hypothetical protein
MNHEVIPDKGTNPKTKEAEGKFKYFQHNKTKQYFNIIKKTRFEMYKKIAIMVLFSIFVIGCEDKITDNSALSPVPPQGLIAIAQDKQVYLTWNYNYESDVSGYNIWVSDSYKGRYTKIGFTSKNEFYDKGVKNGSTYYYAVSAYNYDNYESDFSTAEVFATPRPEVFNVTIYDFRTNPSRAGYTFGSNAVVAYNSTAADIYFENSNNVYYMVVFKDSDIQDMGYTSFFDDIYKSPVKGWSPTKDVQVITGHTYVVWTYDNHYAKFRVVNVYPDRVVFDCAFQLQTGNPYLKRSEDKKDRIISQNVQH